MSKIKEYEATIIYKPNSKVKGMDPSIGWNVKVDGKNLGITQTLNDATNLLLENGYKVWAFRRNPDKHGRPAWRATVIKTKKKGK